MEIGKRTIGRKTRIKEIKMEKRMKKRRGIILLLVFFILVGTGVRIYQVNKNVSIPQKVYFSINERVEFGNDFHVSANEQINGYAIQVLEAELLDKEDYYQKYHIIGEDREVADSEDIKYYYVVRARVFNTKEQEEGKGFVVFNYPLVGKNYLINTNMSTYNLINPNLPEGGGFSLRPGEETEVLLPYAISPSNEVEYEKQLKKKFEENPPNLQITAYPTKKLIATK